jgi:hypothetical protein
MTVSGGKYTAKFTARITSTSRQLARPLLKSGRWIEAKPLGCLFSFRAVNYPAIAKIEGAACGAV